MDILFTNKLYTFLVMLLIFIFRVIYSSVIYFKIDCNNKKTRNVLTFLSFPFPIITGIICVAKYRKSMKDAIIVLVTLIISLASMLLISTMFIYTQSDKYYDKDKTEYMNASSVNFVDKEGNKYSFDFERSGYDRLYINNTEEYFNSDLCYINTDGYLYYDKDMSITAKDENSCVDIDGQIYYPAKYTTFNEDGTAKYIFNSANFSYDRFGKAYTYDYVPYFDENGNKYSYSFDSSSQKGCYTNINTGKIFDNEYSFVDENGYFVYDKKHNFTKQVNSDEMITYIDSSGKVYYRASSVSWDKDGNLLDSLGKSIK